MGDILIQAKEKAATFEITGRFENKNYCNQALETGCRQFFACTHNNTE